MEEKHKLTEEITTAKNLQLLATAYEEISTMKMRLARDSVLRTRGFLSSLSEVFVNVKAAYKKALLKDAKHAADSVMRFSTRKTNGKEIFVLLSSANRLYGDIIAKTFHLFTEKKNVTPDADVAIVGKVGKELYNSVYSDKSYTFFDLPDVVSSIAVLKPLISLMLQYEHVTVFYGRFANIVTQEAAVSSLSGDEALEKGAEEALKSAEKEYDFIFEPSLEKLLNFFETQVFSSLFKQTVTEAELARLASRIKAMEQAIVFINTKIEGLSAAERRAKKHMENRKQLERVAGISLWG